MPIKWINQVWIDNLREQKSFVKTQYFLEYVKPAINCRSVQEYTYLWNYGGIWNTYRSISSTDLY